jgi:ADP-ribosylglycohydrolase
MIGAIFGDIVGSIYEFDNIQTKDFPMFNERAFKTDDTVLTVAFMDSLITQESYSSKIKEYFKRYPNEDWGGRFRQWASTEAFNEGESEPYNSYGNGAAMRVSPCSLASPNPHDVLLLAKYSAEPTHNHPEGIRGAQAAAFTMWFARAARAKNLSLDDIRKSFVAHFGYNGEFAPNGNKIPDYEWKQGLPDWNLTRSVDEIRETNGFYEEIMYTVPEAVTCFVESTSFEDAIRNAISIGGDSDTIACIVGGMAEAYYGFPIEYEEYTLGKLDDFLRPTVYEFYYRFHKGLFGSRRQY